MTTLTSKTPGTPDFTYLGLLHLEANTQITSLLQKIQDGGGNDTGLEISTTALKYTGNLTLASLTASTLVYLDSNKKLVSLAAGSAGDVLTLAGGLPTWAAPATGITIDTTPITGGGSGRILFESATGKVSESVNLVYDGRLAIGSPGAYGSGNRLAIKAGATGDYIIHVESTGSGVFMAIKTSSGVAEYGIYQNALYFQSLPGLSGGVTFYDDSSTSIPALQSKGGKLGIGVPISGTISARVHIISTTEQMRTGYDASNYESKTVGSTGLVTYDAVGSGAKFKFMKPINLQNLPTSAAGLSSGDVWNDSGTLKIV